MKSTARKINWWKNSFISAMVDCNSQMDSYNATQKNRYLESAKYNRGRASAYAEILRIEYKIRCEFSNGEAKFTEL